VETPRTVQVKVDYDGTYFLDQQTWPFGDVGQILVPPGRHEIVKQKAKFSFIDFSKFRLKVKSFQGELLEGTLTQRGFRFRYASPTRAIALFNKQPYQVLLDGEESSAKAAFYQGDWSIILPSGSHQVEILADSPAHFVLDITSLLSSSLITYLGFTMGALLMGLYTTVVLIRWFRGRLI